MKKRVFVWGLYDFANSFVFISFLLYFSKWIVVNKGLSDFWYNATFILGSVGLLFFAPYLGSKADRLNKGRKYLSLSTWGCFIFYALATALAIIGANIFLIAFCFGLGNFFYQLSFVFYNPLLDKISRPDNRGKISGIGFSANYLGQIGGALVSLPFVSGSISLGVDALIAPLIPTSVIFILLSMPLLLNRGIFESETTVSKEAPSQIGLLREALALPGVSYFMLAFFLAADALTTLLNNFSIVISSLFTVSNKDISILTLFIIISAGVGASVWGYISDKLGSRKTLIWNLFLYVPTISVLSFAPNFKIYALFAVITGLCLGGTWTVSRRMLIELVPQRILNYSFGIYAISERASTFVGPLVWSVVLAMGGNYHYAMFSMVIFQAVSVVLISRVPEA